jgi:hypothetical protein
MADDTGQMELTPLGELFQQMVDGKISYSEYDRQVKLVEEKLKNIPRLPKIDMQLDSEETAKADRDWSRRHPHPTSGSKLIKPMEGAIGMQMAAPPPPEPEKRH